MALNASLRNRVRRIKEQMADSVQRLSIAERLAAAQRRRDAGQLPEVLIPADADLTADSRSGRLWRAQLRMQRLEQKEIPCP